MRRGDPSVDVAEERDTPPARCPYCGGTDTKREHPKGPSLCRSVHYCADCEESFEAMG